MPNLAAVVLSLLELANIASVAASPGAGNPSSQDTIPVATPTGAACAGSTATSTALPTNLGQAVAGCPNIQPSGTNLTRNDILDGICKPFTLIFARGTHEDPNLGNIVGPSFVSALDAAFGGAGNVGVQGVNDYPAVGTDYCLGGSLSGSENLASVCTSTCIDQHAGRHIANDSSSSSSRPSRNAHTPSSASAATAKAARSSTTVSHSWPPTKPPQTSSTRSSCSVIRTAKCR